MMVSQRVRRWGRNAIAVGLAVGSILGMGKAANAQLIADDNFSYPAGYLVNVGGGFGWFPVAENPGAGNWSDFNPVLVNTPGLTYPGFGALGNTATTGGFNQGAFRSLAVNQGSVNGTNTVYVSFLARKNPADATPIGAGSNTYAGISLYDGFTFGSQERFFLGMSFERGTWGFARDGQPSTVSTVPVDSTIHLFVYRFDFTATNVAVRLYIDPTTALEPAIPTAQALGLPGFNFQQVRIASGVADLVPNVDFDEFKITKDYATVVGVSLSGRVLDFGGFAPPTGAVVTATFKNSITNAVVVTRTATLDAQGNFGFTSVPRGTYNVVFSGRKVLGIAVNNVNLTNAVSGLELTFFGGDADGDNFTDIRDLLLLINAYNKIAPALEYLESADFNYDGANDIGDLLILINAYNRQGAF